MRKCFLCMIGIFVIAALSPLSVFSQDLQAPAEDDTIPAQGTQAEMIQSPQADSVELAANMDELSIYGEIQSVDVQAASITVQYYDYDNDEEKTLEVSLDKDSKLENVKEIGEVKKGDWADVTYAVAGGKNIAKMVSVEVEEPDAEDYGPMDATEE